MGMVQQQPRRDEDRLEANGAQLSTRDEGPGVMGSTDVFCTSRLVTLQGSCFSVKRID